MSKNKEKKAEYDRIYRLKNKERIQKRLKEYYEKNKDKRPKPTEEQKIKNRKRTNEYRKKHLEECKLKKKKWRLTQMGRANHQLSNYKASDIKYGRETPDFDSKWIVENIYSKHCVYCGESDWHKLGCDRKDNKIGHIKSNVVTCCYRCNVNKGTKSYDEYIKELGVSPTS